MQSRLFSMGMVEPLESRQFLSVSVAGESGQIATGESGRNVALRTTVPVFDLEGAYAGVVRSDERRLAALRLVQDGSTVDGTLAIDGIDTFDVTGTTAGRRLNLRLENDGSTGTFRGRLGSGGVNIAGRLVVIGEDRIRGTLALTRSNTAIPPSVRPGFIGNGFGNLFDRFDNRFGPIDRIGRSFFADFFTDPLDPRFSPVGSNFDTRFAPTTGQIGVPDFPGEATVFTPNPVFNNLFATVPIDSAFNPPSLVVVRPSPIFLPTLGARFTF